MAGSVALCACVALDSSISEQAGLGMGIIVDVDMDVFHSEFSVVCVAMSAQS